MYPLHEVGSHIHEIHCNFHNFQWNKNGEPLNNTKKLNCGTATIGRSGLVFNNFSEPDFFWVDDLESEKNLEYSHNVQGKSTGSWLWMMDNQSDLLHIHNNPGCIHPGLASVTNLDELGMHNGDNWVLQTCSTGWWLFIYPFTFVEWSPGCVCVFNTVPHDIDNEFGFDWIAQFYYDSSTPPEKRVHFETLVDVFREDVAAIELQKGPYFPLVKASHKLEEHCVIWGQWVQRNRKKI